MSQVGMTRKKRGVLNVILNRRSIRSFKKVQISEDVVKLMIEAGQRSPCTYQSYTIIHVSDAGIRSTLAEIVDDDLIRTAPVVLLACIDMNRTRKMLELLSERHVLQAKRYPIESLESIMELGLFLGNVITAAEILGLGSVILDYPLRMCSRISQVMNLRKGVIPVAFLCIGVPNESPPQRPRMPMSFVFFKDKYEEVAGEEILKYLKDAAEKLDREGYLSKYAHLQGMSYMDYLRIKAMLDKSTERQYEEVSSFLWENGLRF